MNTQQLQDFHYALLVDASPAETMEKIGQPNLWWAKKFAGSANHQDDEFHADFGDTFVTFKVSALIPNQKMVWLVTDCNLPWIKDKKEWTGTEIIWDLVEKEGQTQVDFVHKGITSASECYEVCNPGWIKHLSGSFRPLVNGGKGLPV